jgi:hypothetical protein
MQISPLSSADIDKRNERRMKIGVTATTVATTGAALAHIVKHQGFSLSPSVVKQSPIKDWAIFRLYDKKRPDRKLIELEEKEILELASASVAGGLAGGILFDDKKYRKSKLRESVNQLLGNVLVPVACVGSVSRLYKAHKEAILSKVPQINGTGKVSSFFNKAFKGIPFALATIVSLSTGIFAGNRVSNYLNEKVFHRKVDRKIKKTDFAPHVDDIGMAVSLMADKSIGASVIQRTVPAFLCVPGYETGTHRD